MILPPRRDHEGGREHGELELPLSYADAKSVRATATALAERFSKGRAIRRQSDLLSVSWRCGSTESSHHLYDVSFFFLSLSVSPAF